MSDEFVGNAFSVDFFDHAFTFSNRSSNVTCCLADNSFKVATCGKGASCAGQCSALGASLCPSKKCTSDPKTCQLDFDNNLAEGRQRENSDATLSSSDLKYCENTIHKCKVKTYKECCYNPNCLKRRGRKKKCKDLDYLTGKDFQILFIIYSIIHSRPKMSYPWQPAEGKVVLRRE